MVGLAGSGVVLGGAVVEELGLVDRVEGADGELDAILSNLATALNVDTLELLAAVLHVGEVFTDAAPLPPPVKQISPLVCQPANTDPAFG